MACFTYTGNHLPARIGKFYFQFKDFYPFISMLNIMKVYREMKRVNFGKDAQLMLQWQDRVQRVIVISYEGLKLLILHAHDLASSAKL